MIFWFIMFEDNFGVVFKNEFIKLYTDFLN